MAILLSCPLFPTSTFAAEGGSGAYILGIRGPGAAITPPPGIFFSNQFYIYNGRASAPITFDRFTLTARAKAAAAVTIPSFLFVTPAEIAGGRIGFSLTVPYGRVSVKGQAGPLRLSDSITTFADPSVGTFIGWKAGDFHLQVGATGFIPIGDYRTGELANTAKHRGAIDFYGALTWNEPTLGLDVTNVVGVTFNQKNKETQYRTGSEFHWDWSITKKFENGFSIGPAGYYYKQLAGDSGIGATLGQFKGEVVAFGGGVGYDFKVGAAPVSLKLRWFREVQTERRLKGDAVFVGLSFPLWVPGQ